MSRNIFLFLIFLAAGSFPLTFQLLPFIGGLEERYFIPISSAVSSMILLAAFYQRSKSLGLSPLTSLIALVPGINIIFAVYMIFKDPEY